MQSEVASPDLIQFILSQCETEAIHAPESIQPHGFLFACNSLNKLTRISQNLADVVLEKSGFSAPEVVGSLIMDCPDKLQDLLAACQKACAEVDASFDEDSFSGAAVDFDEKKMFVSSFSSGTEKFFELEPDPVPLKQNSFRCFQRGVELLSKRNGLVPLFQALAETVRELLNYDRVLVYRFDADWNGSVVGESRLSTTESFLGFHFPASDIPAQARALYEINTSRLIVDSHYVPSKIIAVNGSGHADLTYSNLRSISPAHIQYMRNMAVRASFTVSIMVEGRLWGLLTAHHFGEPKYLSPSLRKLTQTLCRVAGTMISHIEESQEAAKIIARNVRLQKVSKTLEAAASANSVVNQEVVDQFQEAVLELTASTGFLLRADQTLLVAGAVPPSEACTALVDFLDRKLGKETMFATNKLTEIYPAAGRFKETVSGCLAVRLPQLDVELEIRSIAVWLRPEFVSELKWAGNPDKSVQLQNGKISPRNSFREFVQKIKDRSSLWVETDRESALLFCEQYALYCRALQENKLRFSIAENALKQGKIEATSRILHDIGNALSAAIPKVSQRLGELNWEETASLRQLTEWLHLHAPQIETALGEGKSHALVNFVQAVAEALERRAKTLQADWKSLANSLSHAEHILQLQRLLTPAGSASLAKKHSLNALVQNVVEMSSGFLVAHNIAVETSFATDAIVEIDQTNLMRVLMNLLKNAAESISRKAPPDPKITISVQRSVGNFVTLSIADNGVGFSKQEEALIIGNGFSSKPGGSGGTGLASCREILASVGSRLQLTSPGVNCGAMAFFELEAFPEQKEK